MTLYTELKKCYVLKKLTVLRLRFYRILSFVFGFYGVFKLNNSRNIKKDDTILALINVKALVAPNLVF